MAIYEEKTIGHGKTLLLLALLFVLAHPFWHFGDEELLGTEAEYAVALTEMQFWPPVVLGHGHILQDSHPLFLLGAKGQMLCGLSAELAQRTLSFLMYFLLTGLVFFVTRRTFGLQSASAAAAIMFTSIFTFDRLPDGYRMVVTALLIYGGWMVWVECCLVRANWNLAQIFAGLFGGLIFYNDGITGLLYFLIPIALQRRPLTIWPKILNTRGESKLRKWCVFAGAAIILAFIALWYFPQADVPQLTGHEPDIGFMTYLHRLCSFPVNTLWAMMPWTLLLWAPFCAALVTMDKNPLFGKIHRIFFLSLLVLIWLNPERRVRDLFLLMPLMATMIGTNYWILIRRYGYRMARIGSFIGWCLMIGSLFLAGFLFLKYHTPDWLQNLSVLQEIPSRFRPDPSASLVLFVPLAELGAAFFLGMLALILLRKKCILWLTATILFCGISLSVWAVTTPQRLQNQPKHDFAAELKMSLKDQLPAGEPLYSSVYGLFAEGYYAGIPVRHIEARPYPDEQEQVYMISSDFPADSRRLWTKLHEIEYKRTRLGIYRGQLIRSDDNDDDI